jgi:hypothetical protein
VFSVAKLFTVSLKYGGIEKMGTNELYNPNIPVSLGMEVMRNPQSDPVPRWLQITFRRSHLAGPNYVEIQGHIDAGAQLIIANCDNLFPRVGAFAEETPKEEYEDADKRLQYFVSYIHDRGVRAGAYCGPIHTTYWRKDLALKHPEWLLIGADGKPRFPTGKGEENIGVRACTYGPYGDILIKHVTTLAKDYNLDALWFDGNNFPLDCMCEACRESFKNATGEELKIVIDSSSDHQAQRLMAWRYRNYVDYLNHLTHEVHKANPDCTIHFNFSSLREWGHAPWFPEYPAVYALSQDCPSLELWWQMAGDSIHQSISTQFMRAEAKERPTAVWIQPQAHGIVNVSTPVEIMTRYLHAIANGSVPEVVEDIHRRRYVSDIYKAIKEREEYLVDAEWLKWGAMLVSERTRMYHGSDKPMERYMECVFGGFKAIQEEHLPVRLITDQDIEEGLLSDYSVLYLPNSACLSDNAETGNKRDDFAFADIFHASYKGEAEYKDREHPAYFVPEDDIISGDPKVEECESKGWGIPLDTKHGTIPVTGTLVLVDSTESGGARFRKMSSDDVNEGSPVYIIGTYGKGKVVYFPMGLEKHCYNYGDPYARKMICNALLNTARNKPSVIVDAPKMLQTVFYEQKDKNRIVIHLLNDQSSYGRHSLHWEEGFGTTIKTHAYPQREEIIPLHDLVSVIINCDGVKGVRQEPEHIELEMQKIAGGVKAKVPVVYLHSMVIVDY